jgi:secretion/DNA translocation related TadE-like protein
MKPADFRRRWKLRADGPAIGPPGVSRAGEVGRGSADGSPRRSCADEVERSPDSGAATIWTALAVAALTGVVLLGCWLGAAVIARHRAEAAADLGALAAASHAAEGPARACDRARWVADRLGATLLTCRWQRLDALVEVQIPHSAFAGLPGPSARARAGPAEQPR